MKKLARKIGFYLFALLMFVGCSSSKPDLTDAYWRYHQNNLRYWTQGEGAARLDSLLRIMENPVKPIVKP